MQGGAYWAQKRQFYETSEYKRPAAAAYSWAIFTKFSEFVGSSSLV